MTDTKNHTPGELYTPAPRGESGLALVESQRAIQEVQAALVIAKRFPRDYMQAIDRIKTACQRESLAAQAVYSYARGDTDISGPSIRLAEAVAQLWGNIEFGFQEVNRGTDDGVGYSDIRAYAWDMETNTRRPLQFRVRHWRDARKGGYALTDERDIYELIANMAQRRVRACIMAVIPGDVFEEAEAQCLKTLRSKADTGPEMQQKILDRFAEFGVTRQQIEARIQRKMAAIQPAHVISLGNIYNSIRDGMSSVADWFEAADTAAGAEAAKEGPIDPFANAKKAEAKPDPEPSPSPDTDTLL